MSGVAVRAFSTEYAAAATKLADDLSLPLLPPDRELPECMLILEVRTDGLALVPVDPNLGKELRIDFVHGTTAYRRQAAGSIRQPLARAIGLRHGLRSVVDATAGLGRDAFLLACLGCRVRAMERSVVLVRLLADALDRANASGVVELVNITRRITLGEGDARLMLPLLADANRPDVVYIDPMYVPGGSSALAKKEMRILRMLVGDDEDARELLDIALDVAWKRVVVKRHLRADPLEENVSLVFAGRSVRYDVYLKGLR
jgi:16S rRNA (guanine1516-N2)-methyltransferase